MKDTVLCFYYFFELKIATLQHPLFTFYHFAKMFYSVISLSPPLPFGILISYVESSLFHLPSLSLLLYVLYLLLLTQ